MPAKAKKDAAPKDNGVRAVGVRSGHVVNSHVMRVMKEHGFKRAEVTPQQTTFVHEERGATLETKTAAFWTLTRKDGEPVKGKGAKTLAECLS